MLNTKIKDYQIQSELGRGGMAVVYMAEHQLLHNKVAIKVLNEDYVRNSNIRNRFLSEARNMARMSHPNIIKVTDLIDDGDTVAFVMEYIEGETLKEYLEHKGKFTDDEIKTIFSQMLDAVGYVHEQKLVHRDIKPANFMITPNGKLKLMDFGIAKNADASSAEYTQTGTKQQMGTPMYMSPEQITETKSVTAQSDIYSLGVLLWQIVSGKKPYDMATLSNFQLQLKIVNEPLENTNTMWDRFIRKATAKDITLRYSSAAEFKTYITDIKSDNWKDLKGEKTAIDNDVNQSGQTTKPNFKSEPEIVQEPSSTNSSKGNSPKKSIKNRFLRSLGKLVLWAVGILLAIIILGLLLEDPYPESKDEMVQMLTNKCWKLDEIEINSIVIDGKAISKPSSDVRQTIKESVTGSNDGLIWETIENSFNKIILDKYQFNFFRFNSNKEFYYYSQSFNSDIGKPTATYDEVDIQFSDGKYQFTLRDNNYEFTFDGEAIELNIDIESNYKIVGLSNDMLKTEVAVNSKMDGTEIVFNITSKYKVIPANIADTTNLNRMTKDLEDFHHLLDQTIEEAFDTLSR